MSVFKWVNSGFGCKTDRFLRAGLEGSHVRYLLVASHGSIDQTLNREVQNLNWDKVLVGDVDEILQDENKQLIGSLSFTLNFVRHRSSSCIKNVM